MTPAHRRTKFGSNSGLSDDRADFLRDRHVSRETIERLDVFLAVLLEWQERTNLVAPSTIPNLWTRHVADSYQFRGLAPLARRWVDVGSGSGFPGIVLAIQLQNAPDAHVDLIESVDKKAAFLRTVIRETGVRATVHAARIEQCTDVLAGAEAISARALAPLGALLGLVAPSIAPDVPCLFAKGRQHRQEIREASAHWRFSMIKHLSDIEADSVILEIRNVMPLKPPAA